MSSQIKYSGSLLAKTKELLARDRRSLPELYRASGIPFYWLKKFKAGGMQDPSVNRVQKLYEFLNKRKLAV